MGSSINEPKRIRSKEHLRFVANQPCLICGRSPSHAHHIRYARSRGLSLKVNDAFTVPLCAIHHHTIHTTGKEREWWHERNIDPLKIADSLWQQSREWLPSRPEAKELQEVAQGQVPECAKLTSPEMDASATAVHEASSSTPSLGE